MGFLIVFLLEILLLWLAQPLTADSGFVSITLLPAYQSSLRPCMQTCLYGSCDAYAYTAAICVNDCGHDDRGQYPESCFCRSDLITNIFSALSSCASYQCVGAAAVDIEQGTSVYLEYCHAAATPTAFSTTTVTVNPGPGPNGVLSVTVTPVATGLSSLDQQITARPITRSVAVISLQW